MLVGGVFVLRSGGRLLRGEVPTEWLDQWNEVVVQRTAGLRDEERPVLERLLFSVMRQDEGELREEATENQRERESGFAPRQVKGLFEELLQRPEDFTGLAFTLRGYIRRLEEIDRLEEGDRDQGVYEAWLFTADSQGHPWVILTGEIPPGIATGTDLNERVELTGYFLKLATYQAQDGRRVVPMVLAPRLHRVVSSREVGSWGGGSVWWYGGVVFAVVLGCGWWGVRRREQIQRRALRQRLVAKEVDFPSAEGDLNSSDPGSAT